MISFLPMFREGREYGPGAGGWRFSTRREIAVWFDLPLKERIDFMDAQGIVRARFTGRLLTICGDYSWDGCSPKGRFAGLWVGTPDPPETRLASLVHDVLYQFSRTDHMPLSRKMMDAAFYDLLRLSKFRAAGTFHGAVRIFGGLFSMNTGGNGCWSHLVS